MPECNSDSGQCQERSLFLHLKTSRDSDTRSLVSDKCRIQARDLAVSLDMGVRVECSAGSDIVTAAMTHLAHSTSSKHLFCGYELSYYHDIHVADGPRSAGEFLSKETKKFPEAMSSNPTLKKKFVDDVFDSNLKRVAQNHRLSFDVAR